MAILCCKQCSNIAAAFNNPKFPNGALLLRININESSYPRNFDSNLGRKKFA